MERALRIAMLVCVVGWIAAGSAHAHAAPPGPGIEAPCVVCASSLTPPLPLAQSPPAAPAGLPCRHDAATPPARALPTLAAGHGPRAPPARLR